ncbi:MAG: adenylate/guanylate cyclase domain-containing protein [Treponema sp.]|nr:adenylate/guanylate cyclase domain-containing protein [Candidatus Treponema equifaecale]
MGLITALVSYFISTDTQINAEENNLTINSRTASDCENQINSILNNGGLLFELFVADKNDELQIKKNGKLLFERCKDIAGIAFVKNNRFFVNDAFFITKEIDPKSFEPYVLQETEAVGKAMTGLGVLENPSPFFQIPLISIFAPVYSGTENDVAVILFSSEAMGDNFASSSVNSSVLVNGEGIVLVHPDITHTMAASDLSSKYLVQQMNDSNQDNKQLRYFDETGTEYFGAYNKLKGLSAGVITEVETAVIFEAVRSTTRRNIYLTIALLALVIMVIRFFAKSISNPLELLTEITHHISQGNFNTPLFNQLKLGRKDEVGVLNRSTKDEQEILNTVTSLTNKGVTKAIVQKTIDFKPHLKDITIFFSDIRGFTAISDGFNNRFGEKSAGEIINFLNDYMSRMVACISATGGNVDKFEGDAIMACWGVLRDDDLSFEQMEDCEEKTRLEAVHNEHRLHDMISGIRATVGMRYALMKYNKDAKAFTEAHADEPLAQYKPYIKIGCGLNCGRATVGFMGSTEKMEFTSIGDAVNMASRTESSNKPCGTDILITQDMYDALKMNFIRCEENNFTISDDHLADELIVEQIPVTFEVKGKGKQHFYGIVNMPAFDIENFFKRSDENFVIDEDCKKACGPDGPKTLNEVRELLGIPIPDFDGVNLDAEENKVQVS